MHWDAFHHLIGREADTILWWQMCVRAALIFLFGLALIRLFGQRAFGKYSALGIMFVILVGSTLSRALTANAPFVPTLAATAALALLYRLLESAAARWPRFGRLVKGGPVWLMRAGETDPDEMKRAGVSPNDIAEAARRSGKRGLEEVEEAALERSGEISTLARSS